MIKVPHSAKSGALAGLGGECHYHSIQPLFAIVDLFTPFISLFPFPLQPVYISYSTLQLGHKDIGQARLCTRLVIHFRQLATVETDRVAAVRFFPGRRKNERKKGL